MNESTSLNNICSSIKNDIDKYSISSEPNEDYLLMTHVSWLVSILNSWLTFTNALIIDDLKASLSSFRFVVIGLILNMSYSTRLVFIAFFRKSIFPNSIFSFSLILFLRKDLTFLSVLAMCLLSNFLRSTCYLILKYS